MNGGGLYHCGNNHISFTRSAQTADVRRRGRIGDFFIQQEKVMKLNMLGFLGFLGLLGSLGSTLDTPALYGLYALFALFGLFGYKEPGNRKAE